MNVLIQRNFYLVAITAVILPGLLRAELVDYALPKRVEVRPVILQPKGVATPRPTESRLLIRQLEWARESYQKFLNGRDTFDIAGKRAEILKLARPLSFYKSLPKGEAAGEITAELFRHFNVDRFSCPWIFVGLVLNRAEQWPIGGGRSFNGGFGRGGGIVLVSAHELLRSVDAAKMPLHFQTTLRHELGHAFGLPHVDVYGYDQHSTRSIMAYHRPFRAIAFREATVVPRFIPEDLRGLSLNPLVFQRLKFNPVRNIPMGYKLHSKVVSLGPMKIPGHLDFEPLLETDSGEHRNSKVSELNTRDILPSLGPQVNFFDKYMWMSSPAADGSVQLTIRFPTSVSLTSMLVHTQHGGRWNGAKHISISTLTGSTALLLAKAESPDADQVIEFEEVNSSDWRIDFAVKSGEKLCVRGVQYFCRGSQVFPPRVPYQWRRLIGIDTPVFPGGK